MREENRTDIELLLPWHVTGKLSAADAARVAEALASDPALQRQADLIRQEIEGITALNKAIAAPGADTTRRFMELIEKDSGPARTARRGFLAQVWQAFVDLMQPQVRWVAAAAAIVLLVQGLAIAALLVEQQSGIYRTASGPARSEVPGTLVLVRFAEGASMANIATILSDLGITIVDGPKAGGLFTLRLGAATMLPTERDKKIGELKSHASIVSFVAPLQ